MEQKFKVKKREFEIFFAENGSVEVYDLENPKEGVIFSSEKELNVFVNMLTDIIEKKQAEKENG